MIPFRHHDRDRCGEIEFSSAGPDVREAFRSRTVRRRARPEDSCVDRSRAPSVVARSSPGSRPTRMVSNARVPWRWTNPFPLRHGVPRATNPLPDGLGRHRTCESSFFLPDILREDLPCVTKPGGHPPPRTPPRTVRVRSTPPSYQRYHQSFRKRRPAHTPATAARPNTQPHSDNAVTPL